MLKALVYTIFQNGSMKTRHWGPRNTRDSMRQPCVRSFIFDGGRHSWQFTHWKRCESIEEFWVKVLWRFVQRIAHKVQLCKQCWVHKTITIKHGLVNPDVNFVYTRRKRQLLGQEDALNPNTPNSSAPSNNTKKIAFPTDGCGTALAKSPLFTCAEMDRHIANSGKKHQNSEYHSLPTGLRKAKAFLADKYLHEIQTHQDQSYFYYRVKCFHSFKSARLFLLIELLVGAFHFTGDLFFQWNTEGTSVGFKVLLRPVSEGR